MQMCQCSCLRAFPQGTFGREPAAVKPDDDRYLRAALQEYDNIAKLGQIIREGPIKVNSHLRLLHSPTYRHTYTHTHTHNPADPRCPLRGTGEGAGQGERGNILGISSVHPQPLLRYPQDTPRGLQGA